MKFSFIIASLGRRQLLENCLLSIERARNYGKACDTETLVVFQGMEEAGYCELLRRGLSARFFYISEIGLSKARNYAVRKSEGDYLVFLDDDAELKEDFIEALSRNLSNSTEAICGRIIEQGSGRCFSACFKSTNRKYLGWRDFAYFMGSSHIIKRTTMDKIGLYDENFGLGAKYPAAEESDMFFRLKKAGIEVLYLPEAVFFHPISNIIEPSRAFRYSYAGGAMLAKQILRDRRHLFIYLAIIARIMSGCFIHSLQAVFFRKSIEAKDRRFRYRSVVRGMPRGIFDYIKESMAV